ncbi:MAG: hypothetical protein ACJAZK_000671 [Psychroserpens sp.]|jgi:hypothetical protein
MEYIRVEISLIRTYITFDFNRSHYIVISAISIVKTKVKRSSTFFFRKSNFEIS